VSYTADGCDLGTVMVAEGLGWTVAPDYGVVGDQLERAGLVTIRPIAKDRTTMGLVVRQRPGGHAPAPVRALAATLVGHARTYRRQRRAAMAPGAG
jgi:DNA-binding transcriptional LysR family regulator